MRCKGYSAQSADDLPKVFEEAFKSNVSVLIHVPVDYSLNQRLMLDGHVYQAKGEGLVYEPADSVSAPFWVSAEFESDRSVMIDKVDSWE